MIIRLRLEDGSKGHRRLVINQFIEFMKDALEPGSYVHRQIAMKLPNRSGVDVGSGVKCRAFTRKRGKYFGMEGGLATLESF